jgi:hypothetical protein
LIHFFPIQLSGIFPKHLDHSRTLLPTIPPESEMLSFDEPGIMSHC